MNKILLSLIVVGSSLFAIDISEGKHFDGKNRLYKSCEQNKSTTICTVYNFRGIVSEIKEHSSKTTELNGAYKKYHTYYTKNLQNCIEDSAKTNGYDYKCEDRKELKEEGYYYKGSKSGIWNYYGKNGNIIKTSNYGKEYLKVLEEQDKDKNSNGIVEESKKVQNSNKSKERYQQQVTYKTNIKE